MVPFIVTLGTMRSSAASPRASPTTRRSTPRTPGSTSSWRASPPRRAWLLFPPGVWLLFLLAFAVGGLLLYTRLGRHVFAVGSNEQAARLCGIPVARVKLAVYVLGGLFAGVAGLMQFSRLTVGDPTGANGLELNVIAAVVIGGGSLSGGEGSVPARSSARSS